MSAPEDDPRYCYFFDEARSRRPTDPGSGGA